MFDWSVFGISGKTILDTLLIVMIWLVMMRVIKRLGVPT
jgi:hypothetical protein